MSLEAIKYATNDGYIATGSWWVFCLELKKITYISNFNNKTEK
jgi:hypothetical protein